MLREVPIDDALLRLRRKMSEPEVGGVAIEASAGSATTTAMATRMGRRGSGFQPLETSTINMDISKTFGCSPPPPPPPPSQPFQSSVAGFDNFDFVKCVTKADPSVSMISEIASEDNPMRYKRKIRRVSLICSETGGAAFQIDLGGGGGGHQASGSLHRQSPPPPPPSPSVVHQMPIHPELPNEAESRLTAAMNPGLLQLPLVGDNGGSGGQSASMMVDEDSSVDQSPPPPLRHRGRSGSLISEMVEEQQIKALEVRIDDDDMRQPLPLVVEVREEEESSVRKTPKKKKSSILNSWFFRKEDNDEADEGATSGGQFEMEGIGGGQLTSKVVAALGLQPPSRKESRKMNLWMPQGM